VKAKKERNVVFGKKLMYQKPDLCDESAMNSKKYCRIIVL